MFYKDHRSRLTGSNCASFCEAKTKKQVNNCSYFHPSSNGGCKCKDIDGLHCRAVEARKELCVGSMVVLVIGLLVMFSYVIYVIINNYL